MPPLSFRSCHLGCCCPELARLSKLVPSSSMARSLRNWCSPFEWLAFLTWSARGLRLAHFIWFFPCGDGSLTLNGSLDLCWLAQDLWRSRHKWLAQLPWFSRSGRLARHFRCSDEVWLASLAWSCQFGRLAQRCWCSQLEWLASEQWHSPWLRLARRFWCSPKTGARFPCTVLSKTKARFGNMARSGAFGSLSWFGALSRHWLAVFAWCPQDCWLARLAWCTHETVARFYGMALYRFLARSQRMVRWGVLARSGEMDLSGPMARTLSMVRFEQPARSCFVGALGASG